MLYDDNKKDAVLNEKLFKNPTCEYRAAPFWAWNCQLEKQELLRQIDIFKEMGLGGFHMHCRAGMSTTYLSDDFVDLIKSCVTRAKQNKMFAYLYDEDKWPSGFAGGYVTKDVTLRQRYLTFTCDENYKPNPHSILLTRFDVELDENGCLKSYRQVNENDIITGTRWIVWREISDDNPWFNNQAYVDTLNKKAIDKFIEVTHERYYDAIGDEFGKTSPSIFTDEPQFMHKGTLAFATSRQKVNLPWTDDFDETYTKTYGSSITERLPELLWDLPNNEVSETRYRYHDHIAARFADAFADTCGKWCDEHGIQLTGHMMLEDSLHSQTCALGDCMRSYRAFGIPGIDMLCASFAFTTAKQCQSAVHQYGREGMMSELYGVTGWDFDFRGHKLHGDWQAALGVTLRVPHLSWVSMKGTAKRDYPASISYQSPWYKEYSYVEDHFARLNTALTRGKPYVRVAVVHPVESYWIHFGPNEQTAAVREKLETNFTNVTDWLLKSSIDFDYICESALPEQCKKGGAPLKVGEMQYDAVIVPECETLRSTTLERLESFKDQGGKLIFMGDAPKYEDAKPSARGKMLFERSLKIAFSKSSLLDALKDNRMVEIRKSDGKYSDNLIHQLRRDSNGYWLFIAHCQEPYSKDVFDCGNFRVTVNGKFKPALWDTLSGEIKQVAYDNRSGKTVITLPLYDYDSALLFLEDTTSDGCFEINADTEATPLKALPMTVDYNLSEPNVLLLDVAKYAVDGETLQGPEEILRIDSILRRRLNYPWGEPQPWVIENKPAEHSVTLEFTINSEISYKKPFLALENAEVTNIVWNGEKVDYKYSGYYTDKSIQKTPLPPLKKGENTLVVTYPYGTRDTVEAMYLLGDFGVKIAGRLLTVTKLPEKIGFSDLCYQGLPFYGGVVSYKLPVAVDEECEVSIQIPHYAAAVNTVLTSDEKKTVIAYPPYLANIGKLKKGLNEITVDTYVSRRNCFGNVHNADEKFSWQGPDAWKTKDSRWTYEYRLHRTGIITTPRLFKK